MQERRERAVFQSQLPFAATALLLICAEFIMQSGTVVNPFFFSGGVAVFVVTALAAVLPWGEITPGWIVAVPIADMLAAASIVLGATAHPASIDLAASILFVFPIIWLSTEFGVRGAIFGSIGSAALIWGCAFVGGSVSVMANAPALIVVPVTLAFIAAVSFVRAKSSAAQLALLRQQANLLEAAHRRARRQEQTLDAVLNSVEFGVVAFDKHGRETLVNRTSERLAAEFGASATSPEPSTLYYADRVTPMPDELRPYRQAALGRVYSDFVVWVGEPGERRRALSISARQIVGADGEHDGGVMVTRDVTSEITAIRARDDLVAIVSHELRSPLTSILGYLDLALEDPSLNPVTSSYLEIASSNADRLLALIADLRVTAPDSDHLLAMKFEECDVNQIVTDSIQARHPLAEEHGITVTGEAFAPARIVADGFRLRQVVDNLLTNAIKYNKAGGSVHVDVQATNTDVTIAVSDTGIGLSEFEQAKIFDRYFRAEAVQQSGIQGSGLGMSISRNIVREHGGELEVSSTTGVGSKFVVRLPLKQLELA
ncbi:MAG: sensor histidine kinase [Subtercola sp.]|nr:sensor histidine kinase [Subtercola sp.]